MDASQERFNAAVRRFDEENSKDPNIEIIAGREYPKELLYAQRMTRWLEKLKPAAPEALRLATRCQHICRWMLPRNSYPAGRTGYLNWRTTLYNFHAAKAGQILKETGYDDEIIARVQTLLRKQNIKTDEEMQTLEDVICLVFLENYFAEFSARHDEQKIVNIVRKTWRKMSPQGQNAAIAIDLPDNARALVEKALDVKKGS